MFPECFIRLWEQSGGNIVGESENICADDSTMFILGCKEHCYKNVPRIHCVFFLKVPRMFIWVVGTLWNFLGVFLGCYHPNVR